MKLNAKGFTLVELTVAIALSSIVALVVVNAWINMNRDFNRANRMTQNNEETRQIMHDMRKHIKLAIDAPSTYSSYTASSTTLILQIPSVDGSNDIIDVASDFDYVIYELSGNTLTKILDAKNGVSSRVDASSELSDSIQSLNFNETSNRIEISMTIQRTMRAQTLSSTVNSVVRMRNK